MTETLQQKQYICDKLQYYTISFVTIVYSMIGYQYEQYK